MKLLEVINNISEEELDEMNMEMPSTFNVHFFKTLKGFAKRSQYCNNTLQRITSGSSRIVYVINDNFVLKLAKNTKGLEQNETEADWSKHDWYGNILTDVPEYDEYNAWIISERAKRISQSRFKQLIGYSLDHVILYVKYCMGNRNLIDLHREGITDDMLEVMKENEFLNDLQQMLGNFDMPEGDFARINSWGEVKRNGVDTVVCVDYGLTHGILNSHYSRR